MFKKNYSDIEKVLNKVSIHNSIKIEGEVESVEFRDNGEWVNVTHGHNVPHFLVINDGELFVCDWKEISPEDNDPRKWQVLGDFIAAIIPSEHILNIYEKCGFPAIPPKWLTKKGYVWTGTPDLYIQDSDTGINHLRADEVKIYAKNYDLYRYHVVYKRPSIIEQMKNDHRRAAEIKIGCTTVYIDLDNLDTVVGYYYYPKGRDIYIKYKYLKEYEETIKSSLKLRRLELKCSSLLHKFGCPPGYKSPKSCESCLYNNRWDLK